MLALPLECRTKNIKIFFHHEIFLGLGRNNCKKPQNGRHSHPVGVSEKLPLSWFCDEEIAALFLHSFTVNIPAALF
jgi:hypothetical protein